MSRSAAFGIVGACGATGRAVTAELLKATAGEILAGGRDSANVKSFAADFGRRVSAATLDVLDSGSLEEFCSACSVVVNCGGPVTVLQDRVAQAALRAGCHYVDPAGMSVVKERMLPFSPEIVDRKLSFVVSAGWTPGLTDLLPVHAHAQAKAQMDSIEAVNVYFSDSGEWSDSALRDGVSHMRSAGLFKSGYFRNGKWIPAKMSDSVRKVDVGIPIGLRRFTLFSTPELNEVGRSLKDCEFRSYSYLAGFANAADALIIALLPLSIDSGVRRLRHIFARNQLAVGGFVIVRVHGRARGRNAALRSCITFDAGREYWMNGVAQATVARLISSGKVRTGVHFLSEAVDSAAMMAELRNAGVHQTETLEIDA